MSTFSQSSPKLLAQNRQPGKESGAQLAAFLPVVASFFLFLTGPAGVLQILSGDDSSLSIADEFGASQSIGNSGLSYVVRFTLIGLALALAFLGAVRNPRPVRYLRRYPFVMWLYFLVIVLTTIINSTPLAPALLQLGGVLMWFLFGVLVARSANERERALSDLIVGYVLANVAYVIYTGFFFIFDREGSYNLYNQRFVGPFLGSTIATEVFYSSLLVGYVLLRRGRPILGVPLIVISLWVTFLTGVRSGSLVCLVVIVFALVQQWQSTVLTRKGVLKQILLIPGLIAIVLFVFLRADVLTNRLDSASLSQGLRTSIWAFALETFSGESALFGVGVRAIFSSGISTTGVVYDSAIAWHNNWLALLVELGILGLVVQIAVISRVFLLWGKAFARSLIKPDAVPLYSVVGALIAFRYVAMSVTEMNLYTALSPGVMFFFAVYGILLVQHQR